MAENYAYDYMERREMLDFVPLSCQKILEVGCGDGSFASLLKKRDNVEVWGVEIHEQSANIAASRIDRVLCGDFENLMSELLPANYFDCIVFNDALEHFPYPDKLLIQVKDLLAIGGFIVTSLPNFRYVGNLWEIIIDKDFRYKSFGILDYTHFRFFTMKSIERMFCEAGFRVINCQGINKTNSIKVRLFNLMAFDFFSDIFFMQIATVAQKK